MEDSLLDHPRQLVLRHFARFGREPPLDGLVLTVADQPSDLMHTVYQLSFCAVLQGSKISLLGDRTYHYDAGKCLIATMDLPVTARIIEARPDQPYIAFSLVIDPGLIADVLLAEAGDGITLPLPAVSLPDAMSVGTLEPALIDPLVRLLALLDSPRDLPVLAPLIRREIVWRLLNSPQGALLRQIGLADSRMARIARAVGWIRDHYAEALRVPDLAALTGMSLASFHRHFRAATAMTPIGFQKQMRLHAARRMLLTRHGDIAAVGFAIGYESPSQFSRDYRRQFGEPPGRDAAAIRAGMVQLAEV